VRNETIIIGHSVGHEMKGALWTLLVGLILIAATLAAAGYAVMNFPELFCN